MRLLAYSLKGGVQAHLPQSELDSLNLLTNLNIHRKSTHTSLKILDFETKRCSKLHFAEAQPQLVLNLFLI